MNSFSRLSKVDLLFVQNGPRSATDNGYSLVHANEFRKSFRKVLNERRVAFVNLTNRVVNKDSKVGKKDIMACEAYFSAVLEKTQPEYIIALGSQVFNALTGKSNFRQWVGREVKVASYKVIPVYHPEYMAKSKQREREYQTQVGNVNQMLNIKMRDVSKTEYKLITDETEIIDTLEWLVSKKGDSVQAFDYETTHLEPDKGVPVCLSISWEYGKSVCLYFFDIDEWRNKRQNGRLTGAIRNAVEYWMTSDVPKVAQNAKFEIKWTKQHFHVEPANIVGDTKQMQHLVDENVQNRLTDLAYQHTDMGGYDTPMQEFLDKGHEHWEAEPEFMLPYAAGDADCTRRVYEKLRKKISSLGLSWLEREIVLPAVTTLARIEHRGMHVDWTKADEVRQRVRGMAEALQKEIDSHHEVKRTLAYFSKKKKLLTTLNLGSTPQIRHLLYKELRMPVVKMSKKSGNPSTDNKVLAELADRHPIVKDIVTVRSLLYQLGDLETIERRRRQDGTVFSDLVQDYVVTGRLSSRDPNLQNIKSGTDENPSYVKDCFDSRFGKEGLLVQGDFSQLELRLIGSESGEPKFHHAFENGIDMHALTGAEIHNIPIDEFLANLDKYKPQRTAGKRINFGVVYGITEHGLSVQLKTTKEDALAKLNAYWEAYPHVRLWMKKNEREGEQNLMVSNRLGRLRHIPDIVSDKWWIRESALRTASNFKIQSLGADLCMWSMVRIDRELVAAGLNSCVIGQVHDSIIVDAHKSELSHVCVIMRKVMELDAMATFSFLKIPLKIDIEVGRTWSTLQKHKPNETTSTPAQLISRRRRQ